MFNCIKRRTTSLIPPYIIKYIVTLCWKCKARLFNNQDLSFSSTYCRRGKDLAHESEKHNNNN